MKRFFLVFTATLLVLSGCSKEAVETDVSTSSILSETVSETAVVTDFVEKETEITTLISTSDDYVASTTKQSVEKTTESAQVSTTFEAKKDSSVKSEVMQIIWDKLDECIEEYYSGTKFGFVDIDVDGMPELAVSLLQGTGKYSDNEFYKIDIQNKELVKIPFGGVYINGTKSDEYYYETEFSDWQFNNHKLYRHNGTGECAYWYTDVEMAGSLMGGGESEGFLEYKNGEIILNEYFVVPILPAYDGYDGSQDEYYQYMKLTGAPYEVEEITEAQYLKEKRDLLSEYTDLNLSYELVNLNQNYTSDFELDALTFEEFKEAMEASWDALKYDGYTAP